MNQEFLEQLSAPIPGDHPCGEDMSYSVQFDVIREARREDDDSLAAGDWEASRKSADWKKVKQECERLLRQQTKDLQLVAWYIEAVTRLQGFMGLNFGLQLLEIHLTDLWEFMYPAFDPADLDERTGKIEWINSQLPQSIYRIPMIATSHGAYCCLHWKQALFEENLALKNTAPRSAVTGKGPSLELLDKAALASGLPFYRQLDEQVRLAMARTAALEKILDERFAPNAPSLGQVREALDECAKIVARVLRAMNADTKHSAEGVSTSSLTSVRSGVSQSASHEQIAHEPYLARSMHNRTEAVRTLRQVAAYFREHEPHSPVSLLVDKAAKWAEMPFDRWLLTVVKDESTQRQLKDLLDIEDQPRA